MKNRQIKTVKDVADWRLCTGCGACLYGCKNGAVELHDFYDYGIRPVVNGTCVNCSECLSVCSGFTNYPYKIDTNTTPIPELLEDWGPVLEIWEGYATDKTTRHNGSSGGIATALSLYCLEHEGANGVVHINADKDKPWLNRTIFDTSRDGISKSCGSRYAPASPCDGFKYIETSKSAVFIGKGCDISSLRNTQKSFPALRENLLCAIGIFCAGTPSTRATLNLLDSHKTPPTSVHELRYRGMGWPGNFAIRRTGELKFTPYATYKESWGFLQRYRPLRCYLCPDGTAETADISCGDPWYRSPNNETDGYSLVLVRTERGKQILEAARDKGYISVRKVNPDLLEKSQKNLKAKREEIAGRLFVLGLAGVPTPRFFGRPLWKKWWRIETHRKLKSLVSTAKRIIKRRLFRPEEYRNTINHD